MRNIILSLLSQIIACGNTYVVRKQTNLLFDVRNTIFASLFMFHYNGIHVATQYFGQSKSIPSIEHAMITAEDNLNSISSLTSYPWVHRDQLASHTRNKTQTRWL